MTCRILIERRAVRALGKIIQPHQDRIIAAIQTLASNPRPPGVKKLAGRDAWRLRVGSHRVIYEIHETTLTVLVVDVGDRREIYRR